MVIDYENVTIEYIEEYIEFIDLSKISKEFFENNIKNKFEKVPQVDTRIWLEDFLLKKIQKPKGFEKTINSISCFDKDTKRTIIEIDFKNKDIFISREDVYDKIEKTIPKSIDHLSYIKRLIGMNFPNEDLSVSIISFIMLPRVRRENTELIIYEEILKIIYKIKCIF